MTGVRVLLQGNQAATKLLEIYGSGFASGAASVLTALEGKVPEAERDAYVLRLTDRLMEDPLMREVILREISEVFTGTDSGPKKYTLPGSES